MKEVVIDGVTYIKVAEIAKDLGYTTDYVGQLCRAEKVKAVLVGRSWYVEPDSMMQHKRGRYRNASTKTKAALKESLAAVPARPRRAHRDPNTLHLRVHQYESDATSLIPETSAPEIRTPVAEPTQHQQEPIRIRRDTHAKPNRIRIYSSKNRTILEPAPKPEITFSGSVPVSAVTAEEPSLASLESVVAAQQLSKPRRVRSSRHVVVQRAGRTPIAGQPLTVTNTVRQTAHTQYFSGRSALLMVSLLLIVSILSVTTVVGLETVIISDGEVTDRSWMFSVNDLASVINSLIK